MTAFLTVSAIRRSDKDFNPDPLGARGINVASIDEISEDSRYWVDGGFKAEATLRLWLHYAQDGTGAHSYTISAGPTLHDATEDGLPAGETAKIAALRERAEAKRTLTPAKLAEQIAVLVKGGKQTIECVSRDDDAGPQLRDRGTWTADESYAVLDRVSHPSDATRFFVAVQAGKSDSVAVLEKTAFWLAVSA